jgi:hypothetical protein
MAPRQLQSMGEVCLALETIDIRLEARDKLDGERRHTDDTRNASAEQGRKAILERTDSVAERTTKLESNWESFFGKQGAFQMVMGTIESHGKKIDRLTWIVAVGVGIALVVQVLIQIHGGR